MSPLDSTETAHGQHAVRHNKSRWRQHVLLSGVPDNNKSAE
ncbi:hypothetical protein TSAR_014379 [Trichomalopsis sarcophagae]|uniref:Uncharacterized protein n=1 Tax=Trichomalopsis sarcophagae TaxID=543379 RepID=A0A232EJC6_9HYME|nr:hypothetical protein TSAR_014379 [Trichomalopsis sarcophagae]